MDAEPVKSPRSHPDEVAVTMEKRKRSLEEIFDDEDEVAVTMEKRKRSMEENARQSHEATPLRQSCTIMLKCSYPYSSEHIDFKVEPKFCGNGWKYNLDSKMLGPHNISRYNLEDCFVLTHRKYTYTLKKWLENTKSENKWCQICQKWDVYRPKEEARQIIQGILHAVYELHTDNSFHGYLYHPENFAIESVIEGDHMKINCVFLIHANCALNKDFAPPNSKAIEEGKKNDMLAVLDVIFNQIIKYESGLSCPKDLQKLHELLKQQDVSSDSWKLIVNHPSLWHWKSRFNYIEHVWMEFWNADESTQELMTKEFTNIQEVKGWTEKIAPTTPSNYIRALQGWTQGIPPNTPLQKVFHFRGKQYLSTPIDLLRYLRNLRVHYKDGWHGDPTYSDGEVIELLATRVSELFLVDLYNIMCKFHIKI